MLINSNWVTYFDVCLPLVARIGYDDALYITRWLRPESQWLAHLVRGELSLPEVLQKIEAGNGYARPGVKFLQPLVRRYPGLQATLLQHMIETSVVEQADVARLIAIGGAVVSFPAAVAALCGLPDALDATTPTGASVEGVVNGVLNSLAEMFSLVEALPRRASKGPPKPAVREAAARSPSPAPPAKAAATSAAIAEVAVPPSGVAIAAGAAASSAAANPGVASASGPYPLSRKAAAPSVAAASPVSAAVTPRSTSSDASPAALRAKAPASRVAVGPTQPPLPSPAAATAASAAPPPSPASRGTASKERKDGSTNGSAGGSGSSDGGGGVAGASPLVNADSLLTAAAFSSLLTGLAQGDAPVVTSFSMAPQSSPDAMMLTVSFTMPGNPLTPITAPPPVTLEGKTSSSAAASAYKAVRRGFLLPSSASASSPGGGRVAAAPASSSSSAPVTDDSTAAAVGIATPLSVVAEPLPSSLSSSSSQPALTDSGGTSPTSSVSVGGDPSVSSGGQEVAPRALAASTTSSTPPAVDILAVTAAVEPEQPLLTLAAPAAPLLQPQPSSRPPPRRSVLAPAPPPKPLSPPAMGVEAELGAGSLTAESAGALRLQLQRGQRLHLTGLAELARRERLLVPLNSVPEAATPAAAAAAATAAGAVDAVPLLPPAFVTALDGLLRQTDVDVRGDSVTKESSVPTA